mmetsp:Transcript_26193/g.67583  ORF Transcript_26193/g.67583 Transcript_26193/m.67583 type:complete len:82 (-) Transcript_26193:449-694(-)
MGYPQLHSSTQAAAERVAGCCSTIDLAKEVDGESGGWSQPNAAIMLAFLAIMSGLYHFFGSPAGALMPNILPTVDSTVRGT